MASKKNDPTPPQSAEPEHDVGKTDSQRNVPLEALEVLRAAGMYRVHEAQRELICHLCGVQIFPSDRFLCIATVFRLCMFCADSLGEESLP
jgi:hypothetical protein